jgi:hypothetical protein
MIYGEDGQEEERGLTCRSTFSFDLLALEAEADLNDLRCDSELTLFPSTDAPRGAASAATKTVSTQTSKPITENVIIMASTATNNPHSSFGSVLIMRCLSCVRCLDVLARMTAGV